jgi:pimeloyl-ACP methyl ester carboxylesterase
MRSALPSPQPPLLSTPPPASSRSRSPSPLLPPLPPHVLVARPPARGSEWIVFPVPPPFDPATFDTTLDLLGDVRGILVYQPPAARGTIEAHLDDLRALADLLGAETLSLAAPGVAAGLALHAAVALGDRVRRIALISPSIPRNIAVSLGLPSTIGGTVAAHPKTMQLTSRHELVSRSPLLGRLLGRLGVQVPHMPAEATPLPGTAQEGAFLADTIARAKPPALDRVMQPTLVLTGAKDAAFPPPTARALVRRLPRGEHVLVPSGTQFLSREYPDLVAVRLESFFA